MTKEELLNIIGGIDDDLILRAREERKKKPKIWMTAGTIAACLAIAVAAVPYLQSKTAKDAASMETTTGTAATSESYTAATDWFDGEAGLKDEAETSNFADSSASGGTAPEAADDKDQGPASIQLKVNEYNLFTVNDVCYRIIIEEEELQSLGLTKAPSPELAGEFIGEVTFFEDGKGNAFQYSADLAENAALYKNAVFDETVCLLNHGDSWYYAVEETP